jgi:amidase
VVREPSMGADVVPVFDKALGDLRALGATLVDAPLAPEMASSTFDDAFGDWFGGKFADSLAVYFTNRRANPVIHGVDEIVAANKRLAAPDRPIERLGQPILEMAAKQHRQPAAARGKAEAAIMMLAKKHGLEMMLTRYGVDGFVSSVGPTGALNGPAPALPYMIVLASLGGGAPLISVPMGRVQQLPVGLLFISRRWSDERLLRWAYAYEQRTTHRVSPPEPAPTKRSE